LTVPRPRSPVQAEVVDAVQRILAELGLENETDDRLVRANIN